MVGSLLLIVAKLLAKQIHEEKGKRNLHFFSILRK